MSLLNKIKQNEIDNEFDDIELNDSTDEKEKKNVDKKAVALSCVAIAIALLLGGTIAYKVHKSAVDDDAIIGLLDSEDGKDVVTQAFLSAINDYLNGDITEDELKQTIVNLIADYLSSTNGFTDQQLEALNTIIAEYLDSTTIYTDIDKNESSINDLKKLITEKYESNYNYISEVETQLSELIESNQITDDERYNELIAMDKRLKAWLDDTAATAHSELTETKEELTAIIDDLSELFRNTIGGTVYDATATYSQGDFVFYENYMYVSLKDSNTAPLTDTTSWIKTDIKTLMSNLDDKYAQAIGATVYSSDETYMMGDYVFDDEGNFYISLVDDNIGADLSDTSAWQKTDIQTIIENIDKKFTDALGAERYVEGNTYSEGNFVFDDNGILYVSLTNDNDAPLTDTSAWKQTDVETALNDLNKTLQDVINSVIGAKNYVEGDTYKEGDYVINNGNLYISLTDDNTYTIDDTSAWKQTDIASIINELTKDTEKQIQELRDDLSELAIKQSSDLDEVKENLTTLINNNADLTEEQRQEMLEIIANQESSTQESLEELMDKLLDTIADSDAADTVLNDQLNALKDTTAGDIANLNTLLTQYVSEINQAISDLKDAATWSENVTYDKDAYVTHYSEESGVQRFYHSLADNNKGHEPGTTDGADWWEEVDTVSLINDLQTQVTDNKNHLLDSNGSGEEFQYGVSNGQRGYYVNGEFKPF